MSLLSKNSSSNRQKNALDEHHSNNSSASVNAIHTGDGRTTPASEYTHDQFYYQPASFGPTSLAPLAQQQYLTQQYASYSSQVIPTPSSDHKKSKSFFDRMRTSSNRPSISEAKPCSPSSSGTRPSLARRITTQDAATSYNQSVTTTISTAQGLRTESEVFRYPNSLHSSSAHEPSLPDPFDLSEQLSSATPPKDPANHLSFPAEQSDTKSISRSSTPDEPRQRQSIRDSILSSFLKVPNRLVGQSISESNQQGLTNTKNPNWHRNCQSVSQISLISQEEQYSATINEQYPSLLDHQYQSHPQNQSPQLELHHMAPPTGTVTSRRAADTKLSLQLQQEVKDNQSPSYSRSHFSNHQPSTPGMSPSLQGSQTQSHRATNQRDGYISSQNEQNQSTPAQPSHERDINDNYKELVTKYKKVKGLYFEKTAQVEQLQNTLANQRLSQSRTSLDDSEYMTRFQRLEGAVTNLAFNIRKDWQTIPSWLCQNVNHDAIKIGKQEMTAVGRAIISKFLVDEIFDRIFHPGLPMELSCRLKAIEKNIRKFCPAHNNHEESEALTARVVQWRLATLDGLKDVLSLPECEENKKEFIEKYTKNLTNVITSFLQEPKPPGLEDSAYMIIELAISIASNLPLESRDISIIYPMPGATLQPTVMKIENPIPSLVETASVSDEIEGTHSGDKDESGKDKKGHGILQANLASTSSGKKGDDSSQKVRFSGFVGVEVRGRQVLCKAPVWTMA